MNTNKKDQIQAQFYFWLVWSMPFTKRATNKCTEFHWANSFLFFFFFQLALFLCVLFFSFSLLYSFKYLFETLFRVDIVVLSYSVDCRACAHSSRVNEHWPLRDLLRSEKWQTAHVVLVIRYTLHAICELNLFMRLSLAGWESSILWNSLYRDFFSPKNISIRWKEC